MAQASCRVSGRERGRCATIASQRQPREPHNFAGESASIDVGMDGHSPGLSFERIQV
jgi:hypothetical protein